MVVILTVCVCVCVCVCVAKLQYSFSKSLDLQEPVLFTTSSDCEICHPCKSCITSSIRLGFLVEHLRFVKHEAYSTDGYKKIVNFHEAQIFRKKKVRKHL